LRHAVVPTPFVVLRSLDLSLRRVAARRFVAARHCNVAARFVANCHCNVAARFVANRQCNVAARSIAARRTSPPRRREASVAGDATVL
jgi:hypothetical protein